MFPSHDQWGKAFESAIIELAESIQNDKIKDMERFFYIPLPGYEENVPCNKQLTCHVDGIYSKNYKSSFANILHEGKTTSYFYWKDNFGEPGTDRVPIEYQIQCQHQMICTGAEKVILSVLVFPRRVDEWEDEGWEVHEINNGNYHIVNKQGVIFRDNATISKWAFALNQMGYFHQYEINRNEELQEKMIEKYTQWWETHIIGEKEPEAQTYDDIKKLYTSPKSTVIATEEIEQLMTEYKMITAEIGDGGNLAKRKEQIKTKVLEWSMNMCKGADLNYDDESFEKLIVRSSSGGGKLFSFGRDKKGRLVFR